MVLTPGVRSMLFLITRDPLTLIFRHAASAGALVMAILTLPVSPSLLSGLPPPLHDATVPVATAAAKSQPLLFIMDFLLRVANLLLLGPRRTGDISPKFRCGVRCGRRISDNRATSVSAGGRRLTVSNLSPIRHR